MINNALIIDNDIRLASRIQNNLESNLDFNCKIINDPDSIKDYDDLDKYNVYIIRHNSKNSELINKLTDDEKIVIVLTSKDDDKTREEILKYSATDYILINSNSKGNVVLNTLQRVIENKNFNIMLVDDSKIIIHTLSILLDAQNLNYITFTDGEKAWSYLEDTKSKKVDLIISDYEMPNMNGYELLKRVRAKFQMEDLPMLILSGTENTNMIAKFLKAGANDYIPKPFFNEEFIARVSNTLKTLTMFRKIKNMATTDFLTGLHNRSYFYEAGTTILKLSRRNKQGMSITMIDIDNFKKFNDTYGHEVGDRALKHVANILNESIRESDICVRFGGEEFVILLTNCTHEKAMEVMHSICKKVAETELIIDIKLKLTVTISAGVTSKIDELDNMLKTADDYMYKAKQNGKNQAYSEE